MVKFLKNAFTLAETLIVLVIIGVVVIFMLVTIKPDNTVLRMQYHKAYYALATAAYNIYERALDENKTMYEDQELCKYLEYYINNTAGENACSASYVAMNGASFPEDSIQFIASNGMIFYMSKSFKTNYFEKEQTHRVIWVDINGERRPGTAVWNEKKPADIVAFDITDTGEVVPLGYPKVDVRYIGAKVVYPNDKISAVTSFYRAQTMAFGNNQYEYEPFSYNYDQTNAEFNNGVLKIATVYTEKEKSPQAEECVNAGDEVFPGCSVDIVR